MPRSKVVVRYARSSGPGGQNVNKVETKAEVRLSLADLDLDAATLDRVRGRLYGRMDADGRVVVASSRFRLRSRNLQDALDRLQRLLDAAARPPRPRVATAPGRAALERRREAKQRQSRKKRDRRSRPDAD